MRYRQKYIIDGIFYGCGISLQKFSRDHNFKASRHIFAKQLKNE